MKKDMHGWLDANQIYPGISEDLAATHQRDELYIVTTKQVVDWHCMTLHERAMNLNVPTGTQGT